jgi:hypothetical protein
MSLKPQPPREMPAEMARIGAKLLPPESPYRLVGNRRGKRNTRVCQGPSCNTQPHGRGYVDKFGHSRGNCRGGWPLFDGSYRSGFTWGLITALVIGYTSRQLLYWWNRVLQFFSPTKQPATKEGPSPYSTYRGCGISLIKLIVVGALILVVLAAVAKAISGGGG